MIDTHAHMSSRFCDVTVEVLKELEKEKIGVILAASNIHESKENVELANNHPSILWASVGIHPQDTDPLINISIDKQLDILDELIINNRKIIKAVGECGLDYSPPPPEERERSKEEQNKLFLGQIKLASKYQLPLIIHARKAVDETIEILKDFKNVSGVFHCYSGGKKRIKKILDLGDNWYFGIDGNLTYEEGLVDVVKAIPENRLLLETDSPYLTPVPHRGQVNKPIYVKYIYQRLAEIWDKRLEETEEIVDGNAKRLFGI